MSSPIKETEPKKFTERLLTTSNLKIDLFNDSKAIEIGTNLNPNSPSKKIAAENLLLTGKITRNEINLNHRDEFSQEVIKKILKISIIKKLWISSKKVYCVRFRTRVVTNVQGRGITS